MPRTAAAVQAASLVRPLILAALALSLLPLLAAAQTADSASAAKPPKSSGIVRSGFYASIGFGGGRERVEANVSPGVTAAASRDGGSGAIRLGGALSQTVLLGVDFFGFVPNEGGSDESSGGGFVTATIFPAAGKGYLLRGGLGSLRTNTGPSTSTAYGALQLGVGYDIRVARNKAISLSLDVLQGAKKNGVSERFALLGAAINFY